MKAVELAVPQKAVGDESPFHQQFSIGVIAWGRSKSRFSLSVSPEGLQRNLLLAVDFEEGVEPGDLKKVLHFLVDMDKLHLACLLPDGAITPDQLAYAIAIHEIHAREIEQEFLMAVAGEDVYQVTQLRATITQCESSNRVNYNDSVDLSCGDLKTHGEFARFYYRPESYIARLLLSKTAGLSVPHSAFLALAMRANASKHSDQS